MGNARTPALGVWTPSVFLLGLRVCSLGQPRPSSPAWAPEATQTYSLRALEGASARPRGKPGWFLLSADTAARGGPSELVCVPISLEGHQAHWMGSHPNDLKLTFSSEVSPCSLILRQWGRGHQRVALGDARGPDSCLFPRPCHTLPVIRG